MGVVADPVEAAADQQRVAGERHGRGLTVGLDVEALVDLAARQHVGDPWVPVSPNEPARYQPPSPSPVAAFTWPRSDGSSAPATAPAGGTTAATPLARPTPAILPPR